MYFPFLIVAITGKDRYNTCITESLTFDRRMFMVENNAESGRADRMRLCLPSI